MPPEETTTAATVAASAAAGANVSLLPLSFLSEVPGHPTFRSAAVNAVAVVPLLSTNQRGEVIDTHSNRSFETLLEAFRRQQRLQQQQYDDGSAPNSGSQATPSSSSPPPREVVLVVPNSSLTRPGDWRYNETPLKGFHWQHGCQRVKVFDGRPQTTRSAHDRLINQRVSRDYIDLIPSRRTAAVIGVLNVRDCCDNPNALKRAEEELRQWTNRYSTPPYEVTAHGRSFERDRPVERMFVFDSFHEDCQGIDLSSNQFVAFPPVQSEHLEMLDLHLKIVVNDLAVAIFRERTCFLSFTILISLVGRIAATSTPVRLSHLFIYLCCFIPVETKITQSDAMISDLITTSAMASAQEESLASTARRSFSRYISGGERGTSDATSSTTVVAGAGSAASSEEQPQSASSKRLSLRDMAGFVNPESKLGKESPRRGNLTPTASFTEGSTTASSMSSTSAAAGTPTGGGATASSSTASAIQYSNTTQKLITPLDSAWEQSALGSRDMDAIRKRDAARREKWAADLSLLAGSPLDAYERYLKAAELCKTGTPDPLWYACALDGCAAAHIAMAEAGGYGVDEYLENNFQLPEDVMAMAQKDPTQRQTSSGSNANKQTLPEVVFALCEEALNITNRHEKLGPLHAELLLKLAWYVSESSEGHLRCRWGEGDECYAGTEGVDDIPRWQKPSVYKLKFTDLKTRDGAGDMVAINTFNRTKQVCELLHEAVSVADIEPATRVDIAARCARMCLDGVKVRMH